MKKKITLIGSGNIGGTLAHLIALKELGDITLIDIVRGIPQGKALDLAQSSSVELFDVKISGSNNYSSLKNSNVVIITAGIPRKPGMNREDLLSEELNVSIKSIETFVLGGHGDTMVPMIRYTTVSGIPIYELIKNKIIHQKKINDIVKRTKDGGGEINRLLKKGTAFYAPASSAVQMAESFLKNKKMVLPCAAYLNGEYGIKGLYVGVPVVIGQNGVEKIIELKLTTAEKKQFNNSVKAVRSLTKLASKII